MVGASQLTNLRYPSFILALGSAKEGGVYIFYRAKRTYIPGGIWHLTHRCHNREFLLKFERDRQRWCRLLYEAQKRYHLSVLNYIVTSKSAWSIST